MSKKQHMIPIALIAAINQHRVIGQNNQLPWHLPHDLMRFRRLTLKKPVIMGRKTYESLGQPLAHRQNIIVTRQPALAVPPACCIAHSVTQALKIAQQSCPTPEEIMIIGGGELYRETLPLASVLYLTEVDAPHITSGTVFPAYKHVWRETDRMHHSRDARHAYHYAFVRYVPACSQ